MVLLPLITGLATAGTVRLPSAEPPDLWAEALAASHLEVVAQDADVDVVAAGRTWFLRVDGRTLEVAPPRTVEDRVDLLLLASSLGGTGRSWSGSGIPEAPTRPRRLAPPPPPPLSPPPSPPPPADPPLHLGRPHDDCVPPFLPLVWPEQAPPPTPPRPRIRAWTGGEAGVSARRNAAAPSARLALGWKRAFAGLSGTAPEPWDTSRTFWDAGFVLGLRQGPVGADLSLVRRAFLEDMATVDTTWVPVARLSLGPRVARRDGWELRPTLWIGQELRPVRIFVGSDLEETLPPWVGGLAIVVVRDTNPDRVASRSTPSP